ncbi:phage tail protein [Escherichia coli]|uniref:phage tail protein n=1 Tax=Escherichia coli TaxID=562 RepID=UPI00320E08CE
MPVSCYLCIFLNVGLGEGSALPVGVPVPWPSATPPTGWLKCNGAAFSAEEYPELAKVYPTNKLPDLRGEFLRGWDDGRGVDTSRSIMSQQQGSLMALSVSANTTDDRISVMHVYDPPLDYDALISGVGMDSMAGYREVFGINSLSSTLTTPDLTSPLDITVIGQASVGGVSRPRNVAFNYIVRAA